ncbi:MAG: methyltransferase domain-containing protein [Gammaproteobacteria bacterium]|nr:methyltransferase domain-containing protein [Gammaproteobacteria bacterium]
MMGLFHKHDALHLTLPQVSPLLSPWYHEDYGGKLLEDTEAVVADWVEQAVGYFALDIRSFESGRRWLDNGLIHSHFAISCARQADSQVVGDFSRLPIDSGSLDLVVAHHVLEFCTDPHEFLREVDRTLIPEGRLIVVGFNPLGVHGLLKWFKPRLAPPWGGRFYPALRVREWLSVLGFDVEKTRYFAFPFSFSKKRAGRRASRLCRRVLPFSGALFALLAVKRLSRVVPVAGSWSPGKVLAGKSVQPTTFERNAPRLSHGGEKNARGAP